MDLRNRFTCRIFIFFHCLVFQVSFAQVQPTQPAFKVIPLGVLGGGEESNLSAYLLAAGNSDNYVALDAGTLRYGIERAIDKKILSGAPVEILRRQVKGYLISHPHLDHVAGLILNSPDDTSKNIYALPFCLDVLKQDYFTWNGWANFADQGDKPTLNKYHYRQLDTSKEIAIENTDLFVRAFLLSHGNPYQSTAFLIRHNDTFLLYLGDTGADQMEKSKNLALLWEFVGPLIITKQLKAIFIETSFPDEQPRGLLFGHLTPALLMQEMMALSKSTGKAALENFPIVITHIKPVAATSKGLIKKELLNENSLHLQFIFPEQGSLLTF